LAEVFARIASIPPNRLHEDQPRGLHGGRPNGPGPSPLRLVRSALTIDPLVLFCRIRLALRRLLNLPSCVSR
jgi:hypothetical protein